MKKEKKILITSVMNHLAQRDPWWGKPRRMHEFKNLYDAWRQKELRQKRHSKAFYSLAWSRGWLPNTDFERFKAYAME